MVCASAASSSLAAALCSARAALRWLTTSNRVTAGAICSMARDGRWLPTSTSSSSAFTGVALSVTCWMEPATRGSFLLPSVDLAIDSSIKAAGVFGGLGAAMRQIALFAGGHCKSHSGFRGPGGFHGRMQRQDVGVKSDFVDEIAFHTNILALHAAMETARAAEAGMGLAVAAGEERNLAHRRAQAAKDTCGFD